MSIQKDIFKIAGVKNEKEFYNLFPDEESFMKKHGKEFQAKCGAKLKAQAGMDIPYSGQEYILGGVDAANSGGKQGLANYLGGESKLGQAFGAMGGVQGGIQAIGNTIANYKERDENYKQAKQQYQLTSLQKDAAMSTPAREERNWVRPEDIPMNPDHFSQIRGVKGQGSILAKDGMKIAQDGVQMGGGVPWGQIGGFASGLIGGDRPAPTQELTDTIGGAVSTVNPILGMGIQVVGSALGKMLDKKGKATERFEEGTKGNITTIASANRSNQYHGSNPYTKYGGTIQKYEDGGYMPDSDIQTLWGGKAEINSVNPYTGESVELIGNTHEQSDGYGNKGIGIAANGKKIEAEGNESIQTMQDGDKVIFGNLPLGEYAKIFEDKGIKKNMKFKSVDKKFNKEQEKLNKKQSKILSVETEGITSLDRISENTKEKRLEGIDAKFKKLASNKELLAFLQEQRQEEEGISPYGKAKYGSVIKADGGVIIDPETGAPVKKGSKRYNELKAKGYKEITKDGKEWLYKKDEFESIKKNTNAKRENVKVSNDIIAPLTVEDVMKNEDPNTKKPFSTFYRAMEGAPEEYIREQAARMLKEGTYTPYTPPANDEIKKEFKEDYIPLYTENIDEGQPVPKEEKEKFDYLNLLAGILPQFRRPYNFPDPPHSKALHSLASQDDPVQGQRESYYTMVPSDVSLQDQRNTIQEIKGVSERNLQGDPAAFINAMAMLAQEENKVNAEEMRFNQGQFNQAHLRNLEAARQTELGNLQRDDVQYVRQATQDERRFLQDNEAIGKIQSDQRQHDLDEATLNTYANMFPDYRFDKNFQARKLLNPAFFNYAKYDTGLDGTKDEKQPELATAKKGKTIKRNSSLVRALKNM